MGIHNLHKFLRKICPHVYEQILISKYRYDKIAIDISLYICKYKSTYGVNWLNAFLNLIVCLRKNEINCVFIYDTGCVPEKNEERRSRAIQRDRLKSRIVMLEEAITNYNVNGIINPCLIDLYNKKKKNQQLLTPTDTTIDIIFIDYIVNKMKSHLFTISGNDFRLTKELCTILKIPFFNSPLEAETMCADLCKRKLVNAVLSEDSDVLAYGSPILLLKLNMLNGKCLQIKYSNLLKSLYLTSSQFLDFCIMCGTDYNKNIYRVGPDKAYNLIKTYSTIENISKYIDTSILNHIRIREIFTNYEQRHINIPSCQSPNINLLTDFIVKHNINIDISYLKSCLL